MRINQLASVQQNQVACILAKCKHQKDAREHTVMVRSHVKRVEFIERL